MRVIVVFKNPTRNIQVNPTPVVNFHPIPGVISNWRIVINFIDNHRISIINNIFINSFNCCGFFEVYFNCFIQRGNAIHLPVMKFIAIIHIGS